MNQPLVSVVMVMRNVDAFLGEAIESILRQTFTNFEFIILDFGSTDRSKTIASSYAARDERIKLHEIPARSLTEARNAACSLAHGRYIAIQDADDLSTPDRLQLEVEFMEKHPDCGFVGSAADWIDARGRLLWTLSFPTAYREIQDAFLDRCPFQHTSVLIRRDAFLAVGGYRPVFVQAEDYDLWIRLAERFCCANFKQALAKYRIHPQQVSISGRQQQTFCVLAARASAAYRKEGRPDPLDSAKAITPELLRSWGVSQAEIQTNVFVECRNWVINMFAAKEYALALKMATDMLRSDWKYIERREMGYLRYMLARIYWKQKKIPESLFAACRAVSQRPDLAKNLGEFLLRRIGLA